MRSLSRFALVGWLVLLVSACGGSQEEDGGGGGGAGGQVTITFWHSFVSSTIPAFEKLVDQFEAEHPHIRINAQYIPTGDALVQKLITSVQSRTSPDVSWIHSHYVSDLVKADAIYRMDEFTGGENGMSDADIADIYPALLQYGMWQGTLYAMPMEATNVGILYNKDHFREVGLDPERPPQTWDELRDAAVRLTVDKNGDGRSERIGFFVPAVPATGPQGNYMMWLWTPFLWQAGGDLINLEQTEVLFDEPESVQALAFWKDLYTRQNQRNFTNDFNTAFASQQASMILDGPWNLPRYPRILQGIDWGIAMLPAGPAKRATVVAGEFLAIFKQSEHPQEAWAFVKWMTKPEVQARWSIDSGYLPIRASVLEVPEYKQFLEQNPGAKAFAEQMPYAIAQRPMDFYPVEIQRHLAEAIEKATVGGQDPAAVLKVAAEASDKLLASVPPEERRFLDEKAPVAADSAAGEVAAQPEGTQQP